VILRPGTSGYAYRSWRGRFYPAKQREADMLAVYAGHFDTVELNSSFYRLPDEAQLDTMAGQVPHGFRFACKAWQRITHHKRLLDTADDVARMWQRLARLGDKLGPVLYGLPPNMKKDLARLRATLTLTPRGRRAAVEFRHASWFDDDTWALLADTGTALCIADSADLQTPVRATTSWAYARLRRDRYTRPRLAMWRDRLLALGVRECPVYFKHDEAGHAATLALRFKELLPAARARGPRRTTPGSSASTAPPARRSRSRSPG
jgi:uncharacterized protein YecE (DUF72 family)